MKLPLDHRRAVTLFEALFALVIVGIVLTIALSVHDTARDAAADNETTTRLSGVAVQLQQAASLSDDGAFPADLAGVAGQSNTSTCLAPCDATDAGVLAVLRLDGQTALVTNRSSQGRCWAMAVDAAGGTSWAAAPDTAPLSVCDPSLFVPGTVDGSRQDPATLS